MSPGFLKNMPRWLQRLRDHIRNTYKCIRHRLLYPQNRRQRHQSHHRYSRSQRGRRRHHNRRGRTRHRSRPLSPSRPREPSPQRHAPSIQSINCRQQSPGENNPRPRSGYDYAQRAGTTYVRFYIYDSRSYYHCRIGHHVRYGSCNCYQPSRCLRRTNIRAGSPAESVHSTIVIEELQPEDPPRQNSPSQRSPPPHPPHPNRPDLPVPSPNSPSPSSPQLNPTRVVSPPPDPTTPSAPDPSSAQPTSRRQRNHERRPHRRNNGHPQHTPLAASAQSAPRNPHMGRPRSPAESEYSTILVEEPRFQSDYVSPPSSSSAQPAPQPIASSRAESTSTGPARWKGGWYDLGWGNGVSVGTAPYAEEERWARRYMSREDYLAYYGTPRGRSRSGRPGSESLSFMDPDFPHYYRNT